MDNNYNKYTREKNKKSEEKREVCDQKCNGCLECCGSNDPLKVRIPSDKGKKWKTKMKQKIVLTLFFLEYITTQILFSSVLYLVFTMKFFKSTFLLDKPAFFHIIFTKYFLPGLIWL